MLLGMVSAHSTHFSQQMCSFGITIVWAVPASSMDPVSTCLRTSQDTFLLFVD